MALYERIERSVIEKYFKGAWDSIAEHNPFFALLKQRGNIEMGLAGKKLIWDARVGKYDSDTRDDFDQVEYTRKNHLIQCSLPWSEYIKTDAVSDGEKLMNQGQESIVNTWKTAIKNMRETFEEDLGYYALNTDGAAATGNAIYGMPSFLGGTYSSGKEYTAGDSYADHSTALSGLTGVDGAVADAWSPTLVAANQDVWGNSSSTWVDNALDATRYGLLGVSRGAGTGKRPDMVLMTKADYIDFLSAYQEKQELSFTGVPSKLQGLGFPGAITFDFCDVFWDEDVPTGVGYIINSKHAYMSCLGPNMFDIKENYSEDRLADVLAAVFRGQLRFNPHYFGKLFTA